MQYTNIKVGTQVRPVCEDALPDVNKQSVGEIVNLKEVGRYRRDFYVKTVAIVDEVLV